jgi:uncharacterized membrane protein
MLISNMPDFFYTLPILPIHLLFVAFSFFWITQSDFYGSLWILGKKDNLQKDKLEKFHKYVWIGLLGLIFTGLFLILQKSYLLESFNFKFKMFFVLVLFINSFFIGKEMNLAANFKFKDLKNIDKFKIFITGAVSTISWISAFVIAQFL